MQHLDTKYSWHTKYPGGTKYSGYIKHLRDVYRTKYTRSSKYSGYSTYSWALNIQEALIHHPWWHSFWPQEKQNPSLFNKRIASNSYGQVLLHLHHSSRARVCHWPRTSSVCEAPCSNLNSCPCNHIVSEGRWGRRRDRTGEPSRAQGSDKVALASACTLSKMCWIPHVSFLAFFALCLLIDWVNHVICVFSSFFKAVLLEQF